MKLYYLALLFVILFAGVSLAACPEPDIKVYSACTDACPDIVTHSLAASECINECLGMWNDMQDDYYACGKAEREAEEKKRLEEEKKFTQEEPEPASLTVSNLEGAIWFTRPQELTEYIVTPDTRLMPGSTVRTESGAHGGVYFTEKSAVLIGPNTLLYYLDGELVTYVDEKGDYEFDLVEGMVRVTNDPAENEILVITPHAAVTDRNTDFIVHVDPVLNMTAVLVYDGVVDVNTTRGEQYVLNSGEMMTVDSQLTAVKTNLVMADWDGMVRSVETGEGFTPGYLVQETQEEVDEEVEEDIQTIEKDTGRVMILILVMAAVLMVLIGVIIARKRKGKK